MSFKKKGQKIENIFGTKKRSNQKLKKKTLKNNPRLYLYRQILMTAPKFFNINQKDNSKQEKKKLFKKATQDIRRTLGFRRTMDTNRSYFYDAKFEGNILIAGQTGCGKTTFVQSLAKKK